MHPKEKSNYLASFIQLSKKYLFKPEAKNELDYLLTRIDEKHLDFFSFGYSPKGESFFNFVDEYGSIIKQDPIKILEELNLIYVKDKKRFSPFFKNHNLLIPFYNAFGNPIAIVGRTLLSDEEQKTLKVSKYKNTKFEKRKHVFGLNFSYKEIINKNKVIIVEGQFDCITSYINGIKNIAAISGAKFTPENVANLLRYTNNFCVALDNDSAGECGLKKITTMASKYNINLTRLIIPQGYKDIDSYIKENEYFSFELVEEKIN